MMSGLNRESLAKRCQSGETFEYVLFHHQDHDPWGCMSQFYGAPFTIDGIRYRTSEQYYMAEKARMFNDTDTLARILASDKPKKAKRIARSIKGLDKDRWLANDHARNVAVRGNVAKFSDPGNSDIREKLLSTGDAVIAEASPYDSTWGIGMYQDDVRATNPQEWQGENLLGFALMDAREKIREEMACDSVQLTSADDCVGGVT